MDVLGSMILSVRTKLSVLAILAALALTPIAPPALAQIHDHGDNGFGMDHAMLAASDPADGAELAAAPQTLTLVFRHAVRLETLSLRNGEGAAVALAWSVERRALSHAVALPALEPGAYWVTFAATTETGQTMPGVLHFIVR